MERQRLLVSARLLTLTLKDGTPPEELLGEAVLRILSGDRAWDPGICSFRKLIHGTMKSIASHWWDRPEGRLEADSGSGGWDAMPSDVLEPWQDLTAQEERLEAGRWYDALIRVFKRDRVVTLILHWRREGRTSSELIRALGEDRYELAMERLYRWARTHPAPGNVSIPSFAIECQKTIHHIPTTAFRIRAGGRCLGYSADTAFDPGLIEWLSAADLVVHETNLGVHTPYERLAALPEALRARMRLIHYPDDFDTKVSVIEALRQGQRYWVGR